MTSIAFIGDNMKSYPYWGILYFCDRFVDTVFMIDIIFNFRTAWTAYSQRTGSHRISHRHYSHLYSQRTAVGRKAST